MDIVTGFFVRAQRENRYRNILIASAHPVTTTGATALRCATRPGPRDLFAREFRFAREVPGALLASGADVKTPMQQCEREVLTTMPAPDPIRCP